MPDARWQAVAADSAVRPLVLLVAPTAAVNDVVAESLRPGYKVLEARSARNGLECALASPPDLVICDTELTDMPAQQFLAALQRQSAFAGVPVIMLSAAADTGQRVALFEQGISHFLDKPVAAQELLALSGALLRMRQHARAELERYEHIVATSGEMLIFIDREHRFAVVNPAYAEMYGYTPAALRHKKVADILGPYNYGGIKDNIDRALAGEALRMTAEPKLPNQRRRVLDIEYKPFRRNGEVHGVVVSLRDITGYTVSEEALKESEQRLLFALDGSSAGLWDLDLVQGQAYLAPQFLAMTGHQSHAESSDFEFLDRTVHPDDRQRLLDNLQAHIHGHTPVSECDYRIVTPAGEVKWVHSKGRVVDWGADGKARRMIGTIIDVGARKASEDALHRQAGELAERNAELERFNRATVGRELDMIELKKQVNALSHRLGLEPPFPLAFLQPGDRNGAAAIP